VNFNRPGGSGARNPSLQGSCCAGGRRGPGSPGDAVGRGLRCPLPTRCPREGPVPGVTPAASVPGSVSPWVLPPVLHWDRPPGLGRISRRRLQSGLEQARPRDKLGQGAPAAFPLQPGRAGGQSAARAVPDAARSAGGTPAPWGIPPLQSINGPQTRGTGSFLKMKLRQELGSHDAPSSCQHLGAQLGRAPGAGGDAKRRLPGLAPREIKFLIPGISSLMPSRGLRSAAERGSARCRGARCSAPPRCPRSRCCS